MATTTTKVPETLPALQAGGRVVPIVPQNFQEAAQFAGAVVRAGMAPRSLDTAEKVCVAILHGMEVGFTPMAALQSIAVINNMPCIFGDGLLGLVRASGLLEDIVEEVVLDEKTKLPVSATCKVKRKGESTWGEQTLTWPQVMKAGWASKAGPWTATPARMMQMRTRGWALRDKFADVLRGLHSAEEMQDMVDVTPQGSATTVPAEEPKRSDYQPKTEAGAQPHSDPQQGQAAADEKPAGTAAAAAPNADGLDIPERLRRPPTPKAEAKPVTDVVDQAEQPAGVDLDDDIPFGDSTVDMADITKHPKYDDPSYVFKPPGKVKDFPNYIEAFLKMPECGPKNAARFLEKFEAGIKVCLGAKDEDVRLMTETFVHSLEAIIQGRQT